MDHRVCDFFLKLNPIWVVHQLKNKTSTVLYGFIFILYY